MKVAGPSSKGAEASHTCFRLVVPLSTIPCMCRYSASLVSLKQHPARLPKAASLNWFLWGCPQAAGWALCAARVGGA